MIYFKRFLIVLLIPVFVLFGSLILLIGIQLSVIQIPIQFIITGESPDDDCTFVEIFWHYLGELTNYIIHKLNK